ncbi:hypothetical protein GCM10011610_50230 [Nocardia rhizosphaerihabitans]|uniref:Uncharacterized protein n=1 Tax=Nocardia rhizosphaerihabitans TaxID=1691570 RepID=A0ABQ2KR09_9NOCA|nr:hypothetical protein GCM10011610_50230 [Nocardia rhizosphaerihabitans]
MRPFARGVDEVDRADRVRRPAVRAGQPAEPAAQGVSRHTDDGVAARQPGQAVRGGRGLHPSPLRAGTDARQPPVGVDRDAVELAGADEDRVLDVAGRAVAGRLGHHGAAGAAGVAHDARDVVGVGDLHDGGDRLRHRHVPRSGRLVEALVARQEHRPADGTAQFVDTHGRILVSLGVSTESTTEDRGL